MTDVEAEIRAEERSLTDLLRIRGRLQAAVLADPARRTPAYDEVMTNLNRVVDHVRAEIANLRRGDEATIEHIERQLHERDDPGVPDIMTENTMTFIDLKSSDPNKALRDILAGILAVKGIGGSAEDLHPTVANVRDAAITLFEIADDQIEVRDVDSLKGVLFDVCCLRNDLSGADIFPDGTDEDSCPFVTPANVRAAADVLMRIADAHDVDRPR
jgi:hypothetical protein